MAPALAPGTPVAYAGPAPTGAVIASLNYGAVVTVQWANGRVSSHRAEDLRVIEEEHRA
jgi:hypothetical protein